MKKRGVSFFILEIYSLMRWYVRRAFVHRLDFYRSFLFPKQKSLNVCKSGIMCPRTTKWPFFDIPTLGFLLSTCFSVVYRTSHEERYYPKAEPRFPFSPKESVLLPLKQSQIQRCDNEELILIGQGLYKNFERLRLNKICTTTNTFRTTDAPLGPRQP